MERIAEQRGTLKRIEHVSIQDGHVSFGPERVNRRCRRTMRRQPVERSPRHLQNDQSGAGAAIAIDNSPQPLTMVIRIVERLAAHISEPALQIGNLLSCGMRRKSESTADELNPHETFRTTLILICPIKVGIAQRLHDFEPLAGSLQKVLQIELVSMSFKQTTGAGFGLTTPAGKR